jgi:hypothetical protein
MCNEKGKMREMRDFEKHNGGKCSNDSIAFLPGGKPPISGHAIDWTNL